MPPNTSKLIADIETELVLIRTALNLLYANSDKVPKRHQHAAFSDIKASLVLISKDLYMHVEEFAKF
jgi:hypothetical protein